MFLTFWNDISVTLLIAVVVVAVFGEV